MRLFILINFFSLTSISFSGTVAAQTSEHQNAKDELIRILERNVRYPTELSEKKIASAFSMKIIFNSQGGILKILPSKYFPEKMVAQLTKADLYSKINWEEIFKRKLKEGDALIIPIVAYNSMEKNSTFYEYTLEDLFNYPEDNKFFVDCTIMQTFTLVYRAAVK